MNTNKQQHSNRKSKTLKLTVVDFTSNNSCKKSTQNHGDSNAKIMTSKYTEYFSNNSKPFQVISFPFKQNRIQKQTTSSIRKNKRSLSSVDSSHDSSSHHDEHSNRIYHQNDSVASLHQDGFESSNHHLQNQQDETNLASTIQETNENYQKRQRRTSISIRELLNYD